MLDKKKSDTQEVEGETGEEDEDLDETWMRDVDEEDAEISESPSR